MLPATIAADIKRQVLHYLEATFEFRDTDVQEALNRFLMDPHKGLFKGPWLQMPNSRPTAWQGRAEKSRKPLLIIYLPVFFESFN